MGMSLRTNYLLLDEEQYKKLKNKELYIKSIYDLELISAVAAEEHKKALMFNALSYNLEYYTEELIEFLKEKENSLEEINNFSLEDFVKENITQEEELPITLDEFLNYDYCGEWVINELYEEFVNDKDCYLLIQTRYW